MKRNSPGWMATFADLMALLMCFFVLLLAFSEMDVLKFKQLAGSMKYAFGVQNEINVKDIPKGTSVIAQEFRPGRPEPTPLEIIKQNTTDVTKQELDFQQGEDPTAGGSDELSGTGNKDIIGLEQANNTRQRQMESSQQKVNAQAKNLASLLRNEIIDGNIEIESYGQQIIIRIREKGAFAAGSGYLQPRFKGVIKKIAQTLNDVPGIITVSGHTDDGQIANELYASNWALSSQRALSVVHEMLRVPKFEQHRLKLEAHADNRPLASNEEPANRARNRRVEISIMQGKPYLSDEVSIQN
ncbi:flagellar motor protein MotB [Paraferrimonas sp. SM1919]|uniref:flagellar motor protein MotB n=1 Tax=Paraferrimonas sp. SM1919 TaxID=2662263 RepID=UPI0013D5E8A5|nr:flagellar motor protein MotB [Paraferrimonas sp. SM1919]